MTATPIADLADVMVEDGASPKAIAAAVRALETSRDASRSVTSRVTVIKRSPGAIRSARHRAKLKQNQALAKANDVAKPGDQSVTEERHAERDGVTERCDLSSLLSSSVLKEEPEKKETRAVVVEGRKRGTRLAADAPISADDFEFARNAGMDPAEIDRGWAEFRDYWIGIPGQRGTKLDWPATWRNRVRQIATRKEKSNGRGNVLPAIDRLNDKLRQFERGDDLLSDLRGGEGAPPIRLLSKG